MRILRRELSGAASDKGVLGSRGLTEFLLGLIQSREDGYSITELLTTAEQTGYAVPTRRTLSKRLGVRAYREGDIRYDHEKEVWKVAP